jgi:glycosyltransferase involved in cell wall biosynthesis
MTQTIGLMMVVRNEALRITNFLDYTLPHVDAVAICDQQSDDGTWEIIQKYQKESKIPFKAWQDKQHGISEPSKQPTAEMLDTDWILYLDPDETVDSFFLLNMHKIIEREDIDGYFLHRKNLFEVRVFGENTPIEPKVMVIQHPANDDQFRLTRKKYTFFPPQIHVAARVRRPDGTQHTERTEYWITHKKTLKEQFDDDKRYQAPIEEVKRQIKDGTVRMW